MNGSDAPRQLREGSHHKVMDYVLGDCQMTNKTVLALQKARQVRWVTGRGTISAKPIQRRKSVERVIQDPEPDQSWMDTPMPKTEFYDWVEGATGAKQ